jgi:hypothetical protein
MRSTQVSYEVSKNVFNYAQLLYVKFQGIVKLVKFVVTTL